MSSGAAPVVPDPTNQPANTGTMYTQEQLNEAVNTRGKIEKDKLYADLERLRKDAEEKAAKLRTAEEELKAAKEIAEKGKTMEEQLAKLRADQEAAKKKQDEMDAAFKQALAEALAQQARERDALELKRLRESLIESANGRIISDLVAGNTDEEIRASAKKAKETYEQLVKKGAEAREAELRELYKGALPEPAAVPATSGTTAQNQHTQSADSGLARFRKLTAQEREAQLNEEKKAAFAATGLPRKG